MAPHHRFYRPMPLDFKILELLPEKGMIGGVHWQGRRVKDVRKQILEDEEITDPTIVPTSLVQSRLRSMHVAELVENFPAAGNNADDLGPDEGRHRAHGKAG